MQVICYTWFTVLNFKSEDCPMYTSYWNLNKIVYILMTLTLLLMQKFPKTLRMHSWFTHLWSTIIHLYPENLLNTVNILTTKANIFVALTIPIHCNKIRQLISKAEPTIGDGNLMTKWLFLTAFLCFVNFNVTLTSKLQILLICFNIYSSTSTKVINFSHAPFLILSTFEGPDRARYRIHENSADPVDKIEDYLNARYLSTGEAVWRILGYNLTKKNLLWHLLAFI